MRTWTMAGTTAIVCAAVATTAARAGEQHPRLFITPARAQQIRELARVKDSHHQLALAALKARVDEPDMAKAYGAGEGYVFGYRAAEAGFLSAIAEDDAGRRRYAEASLKALQAWGRTGSATLGKSMEARCLAFAYDWAHGGWTEAERAAMRKRVDSVLADLGKLSLSNLGGDRTSNFVGVIRGAELLLHLAGGADVKSERVKFLTGELKQYFDNSFGDLGACQEGPGYTEYPAPFAFGAAFALQECGDSTLYDAAARHAFWKGLLYSRSGGAKTNLSVMWGVGGGADYTEGWASQLLHLCPQDQLPYYVWWYDRAVGRLTPATMAHRFDGDRHGTVWSLLYYPAHVTAKDPGGVFLPAAADSRGYIFFRNHWQDTGTILAALTAQVRKDEKGWNQPEQLAINLLVHGNRFIGGPAKDTKPEAYSSLLVDGKYTYKDATSRMGKVLAFDPSKDGGYAIVQGGEMYEKMGVKEATRHMLVRFLPNNQAVVATLDQIKSAAGEHTYTWQARQGGADEGAISLEAGKEAGRSTFLMKGGGGAFVKGWVLQPAAAQVATTGLLQVNVRAADADIWVVMWVGQGKPPVGAVGGQGLDSVLAIGPQKIRFESKTGRMVVE